MKCIDGFEGCDVPHSNKNNTHAMEPTDEARERMAKAQLYADNIGRTLRDSLPEGFGFFLLIEPVANGTGSVSSNMKPSHLARVMRKIVKALPKILGGAR